MKNCMVIFGILCSYCRFARWPKTHLWKSLQQASSWNQK